MCGLCKLNAAALDTTVACGYNGIDQHNLGLLPPSRGLILIRQHGFIHCALLPPIAGIDTFYLPIESSSTFFCPPLRGLIALCVNLCIFKMLLPPIAGIETPLGSSVLCSFHYCPPLRGLIACREWSTAQRRRPFNTLPSTFHTPSLRSPPHFPFR